MQGKELLLTLFKAKTLRVGVGVGVSEVFLDSLHRALTPLFSPLFSTRFPCVDQHVLGFFVS